jgi:hypothetical protein
MFLSDELSGGADADADMRLAADITSDIILRIESNAKPSGIRSEAKPDQELVSKTRIALAAAVLGAVYLWCDREPK